jgi:hypothetical protein
MPQRWQRRDIVTIEDNVITIASRKCWSRWRIGLVMKKAAGMNRPLQVSPLRLTATAENLAVS